MRPNVRRTGGCLGIYRPVWLEAKPQTRIEHIAVDAKMDGEMKLYTELKGVKGRKT